MNDNKDIYQEAKRFKQKYPFTICWRLKKHSQVIQKHLNTDEKVLYVFCAQNNDNVLDIATSCVIALTNKRILIGQKRVLFGYFLTSITPDLFNDLKVRRGILWGRIYIDTVKELVKYSNISPKALPEIETAITTYMMEEKQKYAVNKN